MDAQELKSLVEAGAYKPDPARIAAAMLQRRGVRELLTGLESPLDVTNALKSGQRRAAPAPSPRAA